MYIHLLIIFYVFIALLILLQQKQIPQWYFAITCFLAFKWMFNYRKCTFSYIELVVRNVQKQNGVLYRFFEDLVDYRYTHEFNIIIIFQLFIIVYYISMYLKT